MDEIGWRWHGLCVSDIFSGFHFFSPCTEMPIPYIETMAKQKRNRTRIPAEIRFWKYVNKTDSCWLWTGATLDFGYGVINLGGKNGKAERAHRLSWIMHNGPINDGLLVCHKCDVPACVNPDHLFLGTNADNMADCRLKRRYDRVLRPKGAKHGMSRLLEREVLAIRAEYEQSNPSYRVLAEKYGVSLQQIFRIVKRQSWTCI